jgi:hypothetical protein
VAILNDLGMTKRGGFVSALNTRLTPHKKKNASGHNISQGAELQTAVRFQEHARHPQLADLRLLIYMNRK